MRAILVLALNAVVFSGTAQYSIGHTTLTFNDPSRSGGFGSGGGPGRQIQTEIYYPAATAGENVQVVNGQHPVIVFGHGFAMTWDAYNDIWEHYVPMGYILAFPRTESALIPSPSHSDFGLDLKLVEQKMTALNADVSSLFYQRLNGRNAIMGHSMGGGASFLAANGNTNIKTVVGLAPAETTPSAITAAAGVTVPALIFSGSADGVTPPDQNHVPIYNALASSCKSFVSITGGGHCYFANTNFYCDLGESSTAGNITITRPEQQTITFSVLDVWLDYRLNGNCAAFDQFMALNGGPSYTLQSTCTPNPVPTISFDGYILTSSVSGTAYQWSLNGNTINGATTQQYIPVSNGDYTVVVIHEDGCTTESLPYTITALSVEESPEILPVVAPNPTSGILTISNMQGIPMEITVRDVSGKLLNVRCEDQHVNLSDQPPGIYLLQINKYHFRILKQ